MERGKKRTLLLYFKNDIFIKKKILKKKTNRTSNDLSNNSFYLAL